MTSPEAVTEVSQSPPPGSTRPASRESEGLAPLLALGPPVGLGECSYGQL